MICPFCHTELPEGLKFCSECGKPLETTAVPVSVAEAAEPCGQEPVTALAEASVPEASETSQPAPAQTAPEQAAPAATTAVYHSVLDPKPLGNDRHRRLVRHPAFDVHPACEPHLRSCLEFWRRKEKRQAELCPCGAAALAYRADPVGCRCDCHAAVRRVDHRLVVRHARAFRDLIGYRSVLPSSDD